jgi:uncharacterized protein
VTTKQQIFNQLEQHKAEIQAYGAARIGLFGSYSRNEQKETSDIDFLVDFQKGKKTFRNFMGLAELLELVFKQKIDLVTSAGLLSFIKREVEKDIEYVTIAD